MDAITELAGRIGPRPACSPREREAARWVSARMEELGYHVVIEDFPSRSSYQRTYALYLLIAVAAALLVPAVPLASVVLGLAAFVLYARDADGRPLVQPRGGTSCNVVARPSEQGSLPELVVMAHLDTARASLSFHPRLVSGMRASVILVQVALVAVPVLAAAAWILEAGRGIPPGVSAAALVAAAYLAVAVGLMVHSELRMPLVAGANDNASGVEVLMRVASGHPPATWFVITGSEEVGMLGAQAFFDTHRAASAGARLLNLDNVGAGKVVAVSEEGVLQVRRADPAMLDEATEAGAEPRRFRALPTDATVLLARKVRALSLVALDERGVPPNWHWMTDVPENIDEATLSEAARVAQVLVSSSDLRESR